MYLIQELKGSVLFPSGWPNSCESLRGPDAVGQFAGARGCQVPHAEHLLVRTADRQARLPVQGPTSVRGPAGY